MAKKTAIYKKKSDPCWDTHEMVGMKNKGGKQVPNCVPITKKASAAKLDPIMALKVAGAVKGLMKK